MTSAGSNVTRVPSAVHRADMRRLRETRRRTGGELGIEFDRRHLLQGISSTVGRDPKPFCH
jgi:hypothetical protein